MADVRETNTQLMQRFSNVVERDGIPFISTGTVARTFYSPPEGVERWQPNDFTIFNDALLANRNVEERGVSYVRLESIDESATLVNISRAETERGLDVYDDEFDFVPEGLSYPVISVTTRNKRTDDSRLVETPYGQYPPRVVDANGNEAFFDDRTFLLDAVGQGYQIQDVINWDEPDEDVAELTRVDFLVDEATARAVPLTDTHRAKLVGLLTEVEEGKWSVVSGTEVTEIEGIFNAQIAASQEPLPHLPYP